MSVLSGIRKAIAAVREFAKEPDHLAEYQVQPKTGVEPVSAGKDQKKAVDFGKAERVFSVVKWRNYSCWGDVSDWRLAETTFYRTHKGSWVWSDVPGVARIVPATDVWEEVTLHRLLAANVKELEARGACREYDRVMIKHDSIGDAAEILKGVEEA